MAFPVDLLVRPAVLVGKANGLLPANVLVDTPGQAGGATVRLLAPAARAWRALCAAARAAGHTLKPTSGGDSYRSYAAQEAVFRARYTTTGLAGRPTKTWQGRTWWQRPNTAEVATPGTSNHGWALAVDCGEERDSDTAAEPLDDVTLRWLLANEQRYGWSHELQSEPWHIRYNAGDRPPAAVLAYERNGGDDMGKLDDPLQVAMLGNAEHYLQALINMADAAGISDTVNGNLRKPNALAAVLKDIQAKLEAGPVVQVDAAAVASALAANQGFLSSLAKAVNDDAARRLAE